MKKLMTMLLAAGLLIFTSVAVNAATVADVVTQTQCDTCTEQADKGFCKSEILEKVTTDKAKCDCCKEGCTCGDCEKCKAKKCDCCKEGCTCGDCEKCKAKKCDCCKEGKACDCCKCKGKCDKDCSCGCDNGKKCKCNKQKKCKSKKGCKVEKAE